MHSRTFYLILMAVGLHASAHAQALFKCKGADGRFSFQGEPCTAGTTDMNPRPKPVGPDPNLALPSQSNKSGANWDLGPRQAPPSRPTPVAPLVQQAPSTRAPVAQERQRQPTDLERQQAEQKRAEDEKTAAFNRMQRCNYARQQLGVAKTEKPIYSYNNKGERQYVPDENRQAITTAAERQVAVDCN